MNLACVSGMLTSEGHLTRDVDVKPRGCIKLKPGQIINLLKPLYRLTDSEDYWHQTMTSHLKKDLKMQSLTGDLACFLEVANVLLQGMIEVHVDESIGSGNEKFVKESKIKAEKCISKEIEYDNITYAGM